jgi:hypothetical protein
MRTAAVMVSAEKAYKDPAMNVMEACRSQMPSADAAAYSKDAPMADAKRSGNNATARRACGEWRNSCSTKITAVSVRAAITPFVCEWSAVDALVSKKPTGSPIAFSHPICE